jgi:ubiquitin
LLRQGREIDGRVRRDGEPHAAPPLAGELAKAIDRGASSARHDQQDGTRRARDRPVAERNLATGRDDDVAGTRRGQSRSSPSPSPPRRAA